jgi:hypothetical protein
MQSHSVQVWDKKINTKAAREPAAYSFMVEEYDLSMGKLCRYSYREDGTRTLSEMVGF